MHWGTVSGSSIAKIKNSSDIAPLEEVISLSKSPTISTNNDNSLSLSKPSTISTNNVNSLYLSKLSTRSTNNDNSQSLNPICESNSASDILSLNKKEKKMKSDSLFDINSKEYKLLNTLKGLHCQTAYGLGILRNLDINNKSINKPIIFINETTITTETLNTTTTTITTTTTTKMTTLSNEEIVTTLNKNTIVEVDLLLDTHQLNILPKYGDIREPGYPDIWGKAFLSPENMSIIPEHDDAHHPPHPQAYTLIVPSVASSNSPPLLSNQPLLNIDDNDNDKLKSPTPTVEPAIQMTQTTPLISSTYNVPSPSSAFHKVGSTTADLSTPSLSSLGTITPSPNTLSPSTPTLGIVSPTIPGQSIIPTTDIIDDIHSKNIIRKGPSSDIIDMNDIIDMKNNSSPGSLINSDDSRIGEILIDSVGSSVINSSSISDREILINKAIPLLSYSPYREFLVTYYNSEVIKFDATNGRGKSSVSTVNATSTPTFHTPGQIIGLNQSSRGIPSSGVGASYIASYFPSSFFDMSKSIFRSVKTDLTKNSDRKDDENKDEINDKDEYESDSLKSRSPSLGHDTKTVR
jgi:hypothetical protein